MSVKSCEKLDKSKVALTIEADAAAFEAAINKAYLKQRGKISVPGFRPGKAPRKMIESMYGAEVFYEEAVNILLPDAYEDAVKEQELKVVGYPEVELESCGKDGVVFKCTVAVYPEVTLGQYKGLEAPKAEVNVTDEDVENRLNEMADRNSVYKTAAKEIAHLSGRSVSFMAGGLWLLASRRLCAILAAKAGQDIADGDGWMAQRVCLPGRASRPMVRPWPTVRRGRIGRIPIKSASGPTTTCAASFSLYSKWCLHPACSTTGATCPRVLWAELWKAFWTSPAGRAPPGWAGAASSLGSGLQWAL